MINHELLKSIPVVGKGRRPTGLSVSQITDYGSCSKRWQLKHHIRAPMRKILALIFGKALHAGLEAFNYSYYTQERALGQETKGPDLPHAIDIFEKELCSELADGVALGDEYKKLHKRKSAGKKLKAMSEEDFRLAMLTELKETGNTLLTEYSQRTDLGEKALFIEAEDEIEIAGLPFRYIADLVYVINGKTRLRDYKSRAKAGNTLAKLQLASYAWVLKEQHGIAVDEIDQLNFIKANPHIEALTYDVATLANDVAIFEEEVENFVRGVSGGVFVRNLSPFCESCEVKEVCRNPALEKSKTCIGTFEELKSFEV